MAAVVKLRSTAVGAVAARTADAGGRGTSGSPLTAGKAAIFLFAEKDTRNEKKKDERKKSLATVQCGQWKCWWGELTF